jgi:glutamyl-tRNA reductase
MTSASHRSASLADLESIAVGDHNRGALLSALRAAGCSEAVVLSTCSRTEVYAMAEDRTQVLGVLAASAGMPRDELGRMTVTLEDEDAVAHLFRVAAGLDSRILGEVDIQDQVRAARLQAAAEGMVGAELERLFVSAVEVARRIHGETVLGRRGRSLGRRAVDIAMARIENEAPAVAVLGSGRMARVAVERLTELGVRPVIYARTREQGIRLVGDEARVHPLESLRSALGTIDLLLCTTSAPEHLVLADDVGSAMHVRAGRPLTVVDLSVPRNVEGSVGAVSGVRLIDLEGIEEDPSDGDVRAAVARGQAVVAEETARFVTSERARQAAPVILALRGRVEQICTDELQRVAREGQALRPEDIQRVANAIAGKLLHAPIVAAREAAAADDAETIAQLCRLFRIEPSSTSAVSHTWGPVGPIVGGRQHHQAAVARS